MPQPPTPAASPPPVVPQVFEVRQWVRRQLLDSLPSMGSLPPPAAMEAARAVLLLVGVRGQEALERELGAWLVGMLHARARRRGITHHQWNLTAWAWLFHRAGIVEASRRDPDLFDRAMQQA
eukprot:8473422-Alexandrium_andersonii.AAC.1